MMGDNSKLFQINDKPMRFHLIHLTTDELVEYKALIEHAGGEMASDSEHTFVKFTTECSVSPIYEWAAIYNVTFIRKCVENQTFVDPRPYRLKKPNALRDDCQMSHFLFGCMTCLRQAPSMEDPQRSTVVATNESGMNDIFLSPLEIDETPEFVSSRNSNLSSASKQIDGDERKLELVANDDIKKSVSAMAGGDRATTSDVINDRHEKRPRSLEYQLQVIPKMEPMAEQQRMVKIINEQLENVVKNPFTNLSKRETANHRHQRTKRKISETQRIINRTPEIVECTRETVEKRNALSFISNQVEIRPKTLSLSDPESPKKKLHCSTDNAENTASTGNIENTRNVGRESDPSSIILISDKTERATRHDSTKSPLEKEPAAAGRLHVPTPRRMLFDTSERKVMIKYLIDNKAISQAKGHTIWKRMIAQGVLAHRTYQSLHNHFKKHVLPRIEDASNMIDKTSMKEFLCLKKISK